MTNTRRVRLTSAPSYGSLSRLLSFYGNSRESNANTDSADAQSQISSLPEAGDDDHNQRNEQQGETWELQAIHRQGVETMARNGAVIVDVNHPGWPYDRDNVINWRPWVKVYHAVAYILLCALVSFASATYTPALMYVEASFGVSFPIAIIPMSLYFLGLAIGSPISEAIIEVYGRRHLNLVASLLFLVFTVAAGWAPNIATLAVFRFLAGVMGSAPMVTGTDMIVDLCSELYHGHMLAGYGAVMFTAIALGFMAGGLVVTIYRDWRWTMWSVLFAGAPIYIFALPTQETHAKAIVRNRARRLQLTIREDPATQGFGGHKALLMARVSGSLKMLFTEKIVALSSLHIAYNFSLQYCLATLLPTAFMNAFEFNVWETSHLFLGVPVGIATALCFITFLERVHLDEVVERGEDLHPPSPKKRLSNAMVGSFCVPFGILWLGWVFQQHTHWFNATSSLFFIGAGVYMINVAVRMYLAGVYGVRGPRAAAASDLARNVLAGILPFFMQPMYARLDAHWALALLGGLSVVGFIVQIVIRQFPPKQGD